MAAKEIRWLGSALKDLRAFPQTARHSAGLELRAIQNGQQPGDFKPMPSVGRGVYEIRIHTEGQAFRVFYVAKFSEAVYVLHAFEKKTQKTSKQDLEIGRKRYKEMQDLRRQKP